MNRDPSLPAAFRRDRPLLAVALLAAALAIAALGDAAFASRAVRAPAALVAVARFVTGFGTSGYMFAYSALIGAVALAALGRGRATWRGKSVRLIAERALYVFVAVAASGAVDQALKHLIGRARPVLLAAEGPYSFHPLSIADRLASFPSGHTTSAFAAAVALGYMRPAWRPWLIGAAVSVGASRILVGAHYPSDVVGGAALGIGVSRAVAQSFARRGIAFRPRAGRAVIVPLGPLEPRTSA